MDTDTNKAKILISAGAEEPLPPYVEAIEAAGGIACAGYYPEDDGSFDGLLLTGGADIMPSLFGEEPDGSWTPDPKRDECELKLIESFKRAGKPILGICRGAQLMNAAFGGTLIQHLPQTPRHREEGRNLYHPVVTEKGSIISELYGERFTVNSRHHQAVKTPGEGFYISARSEEDGVIEFIEHENGIWLGVQFHPEQMLDKDLSPDGIEIYRYFIALCLKSIVHA